MSVILATGGYDHKIRFWEAPSGLCAREVSYPGSQVNCLEITPDKQFLAAGGNPHIRLYEINNTMDSPVLTLEGHTSSVTSLGFQRDGRYLYSGSEDGTSKKSKNANVYIKSVWLEENGFLFVIVSHVCCNTLYSKSFHIVRHFRLQEP